MKIDSISGPVDPMGDLLKMIASQSSSMSDKLIKTDIEMKVKEKPADYMGQNIDTYA
jgi:hypothetical protein